MKAIARKASTEPIPGIVILLFAGAMLAAHSTAVPKSEPRVQRYKSVAVTAKCEAKGGAFSSGFSDGFQKQQLCDR